MATTYYKKTATSTLNTNTAWSATGPSGADNFGPPADVNNAIAQWDPTSLGTLLTGAFTANQIFVNSAAGPIGHSTGTITVGTGGFTFSSSNARSWTEAGTIAVGTNSQTWSLGNTTNAGVLILAGTTALSGSSTINLIKTPSSNFFGGLIFNTAATFSGTIILNADTSLGSGTNASDILPSATVQVDGANTLLFASGAPARLAVKDLIINNDVTLVTSAGGTSRTLTITNSGVGTVQLGAVTRTLTVSSSETAAFTGPITGTAGFTKAGAGTLTLSAANSGLSGDVLLSAGTLTTTTSVNALQNVTLNVSASWSGTFTPLTNSNIGAIKGNDSTKTIALAALAINVGGYNSSETFSGKFTGSALITKNGTGTWTLDGDNSGHTGGFTVGTSGSGTLVAGSAGAVGASSGGNVNVITGSTLQVAAAVAKGSASLTLAGAGIGSNGALRSLSGTTSYTASGYTITSDVTIGVDAGTMTLGGAGAVMGTGGINKVGAGELVLSGTNNTLDRQIIITAGTLTAAKIANTGVASSLGRGNTTSAIALTGTLNFSGTGTDSTNRSITFTGSAPALAANGQSGGTVTYTASTQAAGSRTITFKGASTAANVFSGTLANDGVGGTTALLKNETGTWNIPGTHTHSGATTVAAGTLGANGSTTTLSNSTLTVTGGTVANGTFVANTVMTGGTITATLDGNKTLTVNSGSTATLNPAATDNTFSGNTTVASGAVLDLATAANPSTAATGRVLGTSAVSVTGTIRTKSAGTQAGKMRYGGNLTFNAGSTLSIGGAA